MCRYAKCTDEELIARLRSGEAEISDYLMEKYKGFVRKKARTMFLIGGETDDLIQEGMIGLFKAVQSYQPDKEASFQTFAGMCIDRQLYSAVQNSNRQKHKPLNSYISLSEEQESNELEASWWENPENIIIDQESVKNLEQEIRRVLSPMENRVLEYYLKGYGYAVSYTHLDVYKRQEYSLIDTYLPALLFGRKSCIISKCNNLE